MNELPNSKVLCKKNLYKSTYLKNAFIKGYCYSIIREDDFIWIRDENGREFNFTTSVKPGVYYHFNDYFDKILAK